MAGKRKQQLCNILLLAEWSSIWSSLIYFLSRPFYKVFQTFTLCGVLPHCSLLCFIRRDNLLAPQKGQPARFLKAKHACLQGDAQAAELQFSPVGLASGTGCQGRGLSSMWSSLSSLSACSASDDLQMADMKITGFMQCVLQQCWNDFIRC